MRLYIFVKEYPEESIYIIRKKNNKKSHFLIHLLTIVNSFIDSTVKFLKYTILNVQNLSLKLM